MRGGEDDDKYEVEIDLPGFKKDEVQVELRDGYLESMYQKCHWILRRSQQVFSQVILLRRSMVRQL